MKHSPSGLPDELRTGLMDAADGSELEAVWAMLAEATPSDETDSEAMVRAVRVRAGLEVVRPPESPDVVSLHRSRRWIPLAAAATVGLLALFGTWAVRPVTVDVPAGERLTHVLPDGSTVELNSGSLLRHARGAHWTNSEERVVELDGEAFFEVEPTPRPFVVRTSDAEVRVLGTRFNVRTRGAGTAVAVEEGRVAVRHGPESREAVLGAGESIDASASGGILRLSAAELESTLTWRTGGFSAQRWPLSEILAELGIRFDLDIRLLPDVDGSRKLSVFFPDPGSAESLLADICSANGLRYRAVASGFEVFEVEPGGRP